MLQEYYNFKSSIKNLDQLIADIESINTNTKKSMPKTSEVRHKKDPVEEFLRTYVGE